MKERFNFKYIFAALVLVVFVLFSGCKKNTVTVGFYNVPETVQNALQKQITAEFGEDISFSQINLDKKYSAKKTAEKYDLVFASNGNMEKNLLPYAVTVESDLSEMFPLSFRKNIDSEIPVLLNHYGLSYNVALKNKADAAYPHNLDEFESYLLKTNKKIQFPLFIAGGNDEYFLAFISALVESQTGTKGYNNFVKALKNTSNVNQLISTQLDENQTLGSVLEILKKWHKSEYLYTDWINWQKGDLAVLCEESKIGVAFISLSDFHQMNQKTASGYANDRFPVKETEISHSIIAPEIVCINFSKNNLCKEIQNNIADSKTQKNLSKLTKLAPAEKTAQAYDKQCSDVRFLAAACTGGPVPSAYNELDSDSEKRTELCSELRKVIQNMYIAE